MPFRQIGLALFVLATAILTQCSPDKSKTLLNYLNSNYKNKLDVKALIGKDRPVIGFIIKNDKALLTVTTPPGKSPDSCFYIIVDLPQRKIVHTVVSPFTYYATHYDLKGDSIFCLSAFNSDDIRIISTKTGQTRELLTSSNITTPGKIITFDKFTLLTNSLYGSSTINRATGKVTMFENASITNQYAVSFPLDSTNNLLSGIKTHDDSLKLIAIDQLGEEVWSSKIKIRDDLRSNVDPIQIFRADKYFIVRNSGQVLALEAGSGKLIWNTIFLPYTTKAMLWNQKLLLYTFNSHGIMGENQPMNVNIKLITLDSGNVIWNKDFKTIGNVDITPGNNELILWSDNSLKVLNEKGKIKTDTTILNEYTTLKMDEITGKNYILYNGEILYW